MSELTPITRVESYLDAIVNSGTPPLEDITRIETFLQAIYDNQICALTPITRIEMFLGKISGQDIVLPEPITRIELYLAAIAGEDVELPENPITRLEMYLAEWADSGDWTTISGAIVEFVTQRAHKLKSCVVNMEPKQDLHGYDNPWPAGGGANICDPLLKFTAGTYYGVTLSTTDGYYLTLSGTGTESGNIQCPAIPVADCVVYPAGTYTSTGAIFSTYKPDGSWYTNRQVGTWTADSDFIIRTAYVQISEGATPSSGLRFLSLAKGSTALTSWTPYSNICPISGWTGVTVYDRSKNLFDKDAEGKQAGYALDYNTGNAYQTSSGNYSVSDYIPVKGGQSYIASGNTKATDYCWYDENKAFISGGGNINVARTAPTNASFARIDYWRADESSVQFELGSTATTYEEYRGNSYSVTFEETVYGGSVDLVSGKLIIDRAYKTFGELTGWQYRSDQFDVSIPDGKPQSEVGKPSAFITDTYETKESGTSGLYPNDTCAWQGVTTNQVLLVRVRDHSFTTLAEFRTATANVHICYELATPIEIQLTPQQVTALKGYNAMWSDAGDIEVTVHGTPVEVETLQALNMLLGGAYRNDQTAEDVSDEEALDIILGGENK